MKLLPLITAVYFQYMIIQVDLFNRISNKRTNEQTLAGGINYLTALIILSILLVVPLPLFAQEPAIITSGIPNCDFESGQLDTSCIPSFLIHVIDQVFMLTGAISLIVIMVGGYQYALGNIVGGKEKGQATIRYGIIGLIVSAFSFFILDFVISAIAGL